MTIRHSILIAITCLALAGQALAQPGGKRDDIPNELVNALDLTETQLEQLQAMRESQRQQRQATRKRFHDTTQTQRAQMETEICALRAQRDAVLDEILTPEQRSELATIEAIREAKREQRRRGQRQPIRC
jgi:Spy/CpxP family protein refolding chaperone